ncbi:hypothetical protein ASE74_06730 [Pedobacter sp. Leaf216]|uniref:hypothetical protein n=1 Tax=Pedobacter sp. Leaf216 TaxID=1735684 RepID=UPI0006FE62E2|nr:hypothetical protein [Pedobacter sp. Leaf216]KQM67156.1 hypothetical protein ASE74_06730 [Pedobacter sp. Leaf216]
MSRFKFFDDEQPVEIRTHQDVESTTKQKIADNSFKAGKARYRSEQLVVIKVDGIIENHADTKLEYTVEKIIKENQLLVDVKLVDQIVKIQPEYLQDSFDLMSKIDLIKSNALIAVNPINGKIDKIENIEQIRENWDSFKKDVIKNTSFIQSDEMKKSIFIYLNNTEPQFIQENLIQDFQIRPFFDLFFDRYLVSKNFTVNNNTKLYYSQLFDRLPIELDFENTISSETPETITILKSGSLNRKNLNINDFEKIYDLRYKPRIGFKFDGYDFTHRIQISYDQADEVLLDAQMTINEVVKNNIEVFVDYKIRRIN